MAGYMLTGFDLARVGSMKVAVNDGDDSGTASVAVSTYAHRSLAAVKSGYAALAPALDTAITAVLATNGITVAWSSSTLKYTITPGAATALDFRSATLGDDSGQRLAAALGFNYQHDDASGGSASDPYDVLIASGTSHVSNVIPAYALALERDGMAEYTRPFETSGQTVRQVSSNGTAYSIGPATYERRLRGKLRFQTLATVHASEADDTVAPWTYEDLLTHARCWEPVLLSLASEDLVFQFVDAEFSEEARTPVWSNFHAKWDLALHGQFLGRL